MGKYSWGNTNRGLENIAGTHVQRRWRKKLIIGKYPVTIFPGVIYGKLLAIRAASRWEICTLFDAYNTIR